MKLSTICVLSLLAFQVSGQVSPWTVVVDVLNLTRGIIYSCYTEMGLVDGAMCIKHIPDKIVNITEEIIQFTEGEEVTFKKVIMMVKDVVFIAIQSIDDCTNIPEGITTMIAYFQKISTQPGQYWVQFLKNGIAEALALGGQIEAILVDVQNGNYFGAGAEIGDIVYDLIFLKMKDF